MFEGLNVPNTLMFAALVLSPVVIAGTCEWFRLRAAKRSLDGVMGEVDDHCKKVAKKAA